MRQVEYLILISIVSTTSVVKADNETTLFDGRGNASAYIANDDDFTLYLWDGKPVAYLGPDSPGGYHVYGFNGRHLGWFVGGVVWDHDGNAACAIKERLQSTQFEPFKDLSNSKASKNLRSFDLFSPIIGVAHCVGSCLEKVNLERRGGDEA